MRRTH